MKKIVIFFTLLTVSSNSYSICGSLFQNSPAQERLLQRESRRVKRLLNNLVMRNYTKRTIKLLRQSLLKILNNNPSPSMQMESVETVKEILSKVFDKGPVVIMLKDLIRKNPPPEVQKAIVDVTFERAFSTEEIISIVRELLEQNPSPELQMEIVHNKNWRARGSWDTSLQFHLFADMFKNSPYLEVKTAILEFITELARDAHEESVHFLIAVLRDDSTPLELKTAMFKTIILINPFSFDGALFGGSSFAGERLMKQLLYIDSMLISKAVSELDAELQQKVAVVIARVEEINELFNR